MLSMKPKGKAVDFNHIKEKVERDLKIKERKEVEEVLNQLISLKMVYILLVKKEENIFPKFFQK